jgi:hypothetical protein
VHDDAIFFKNLCYTLVKKTRQPLDHPDDRVERVLLISHCAGDASRQLRDDLHRALHALTRDRVDGLLARFMKLGEHTYISISNDRDDDVEDAAHGGLHHSVQCWLHYWQNHLQQHSASRVKAPAEAS